MWLRLAPILLLVGSNVFMTFAWYGHLKHRETALWKVILVSWGIAFFEYCLQVPANRLGSRFYTPDQLKVIQEVVTLSVFGVFTVFYFGDRLHWNHFAAFACLIGGAFFMFHKF
ncbi:MAG TPA: DMT family protein [Granulicella sp.]